MSASDDVDRQIDQWAEKIHAKAEKYKAMTAELESVSGSAESPSGAVRVTVNRGGILTALDITDDIRTMRGSQLAGEIMSAIRTAQSTLGEQVVAVMQEQVPEDADSIAAVADNYAKAFAGPADEDEDQAQPPARATESGPPPAPGQAAPRRRDHDDDDDMPGSVFE